MTTHRTIKAEQDIAHKPHYHTVQMLPPNFLNELLNSLGLHESNILPLGSEMWSSVYESDFAFKFCSTRYHPNAYLGEKSKVLYMMSYETISHKCST